MADVRQITLKNGNGQTIDCLLKSSFFNDLSGLGYDDTVTFISYANGFYTPLKRRMVQSNISGRMSFITRSSAYSDYRTLTEWVSTAEHMNANQSLTMIYTPYGTTSYQMEVLLTSISKGEMDLGGFLSCSVNFQGLTPWYIVDPLHIDFSQPTGDYTSQYSRTFSYVYLINGTSIQAKMTLSGAMEGRFRLEVSGNFTSPIVELFDSQGELIGYIEVAGAVFSTGQTFIVDTLPSSIGVWRESSGGVLTDLTDLIDIQDGVDVYYSIPADELVTIRVRASGGTDLAGDLYLYTFYKTR